MGAFAEPIVFSKTATVIAYDGDGRITEVPLSELAQCRQLNANDFYIKDNTANDGVFNIRDTLFTYEGELFDMLSKYVTVVKLQPAPTAINKYDSDIDKSFRYYQGNIQVLMSEEVDLTATPTITIDLPTGFSFYCDEIGLIATDAGGVTVQPTIRIGFSGDDQGYLADLLLSGSGSLTASKDRFSIVPLTGKGKESALNAAVTIGATATRLKGRFYFKGFYVQNQ